MSFSSAVLFLTVCLYFVYMCGCFESVSLISYHFYVYDGTCLQTLSVSMENY